MVLIDLARFALKEAHDAGADAADVSIARGCSQEVELQEEGVVSCDERRGVTATVRCFVKGGRGVHVCHGLERGDLVYAAQAATSAARAAGPDPDFGSLPGPEPAGTVEGLWDDWVSSMAGWEARGPSGPQTGASAPKGAAGTARACVERALEVAGDANVSGALSFVASEGAFANSLGIEAAERATSAAADIMCVIRRDGKTGSYADFDCGRRREDVDLERVGELAARGALRYLGPRKIPGGEMPLVMGPLSAGGFLESLARAACAEPIQRRRSFLCPYAQGKRGKRIAASCLTLEDDGRWPAGLHSSSRDGEGSPTRPMVIVEEGVFANMLHNSYTAGKAGVKSTGHGSQLGGTSPTNLRPHVGRRPALEMIADVRDGLYIDSSMLSPHPVTGEISATVDWAMKIERGELAFPVTGIAVSGNVLDWLRSLEEISSDYREEPGSVLPTMLFGKVRVVS